jgi:DNA-directed RNA polymerase specialized sigma24 family protein
MDERAPRHVTVCNRRRRRDHGKVDKRTGVIEVSVLADHRVDPGDDGSSAAASRAPGTLPPDVAHDDVLADPADPRYAEAGYAETEYAEYPDAEYADPGYADPAQVDQYAAPTPLRPEQLRADFGAHFEAHYQRLVAQLYAITLNPAEAHDVVREAYSRAWRKWAEIGVSTDPAAWVRRVAVRITMRSWRRTVARMTPGRRRALADGGEPRTRAVLLALGRLHDPERRAVVLVDMAGVPVVEVAALEQVPPGTVAARLSRARRVVGDALAESGSVVPASALEPRGRY